MRFLLLLLVAGCGGDAPRSQPAARPAEPPPLLGEVGEGDEEDFPFVGIPLPGPDGPYESRVGDTVVIRGAYLKGQPHGEWKGYFDDGTPRVRGAFVSGRQDGEWTTWWPNGKLREVGSYAAGEALGTWRLWYPNGQLFETMAHEGGEPHGPWTIHWDDGSKADAMTYERGEQVGVEEDFDRTGRKVAEGGFAKNRPTGTWRCFEADGTTREVPAPKERITPREACGFGSPPDLPGE